MAGANDQAVNAPIADHHLNNRKKELPRPSCAAALPLYSVPEIGHH